MTERHDHRNLEEGVMVDVGQGSGALVIYTRDALSGQEIEIAPVGSDANRVHTDVLRRKTQSGYVHAAVFGSLPAGEYHLWHDGLPKATHVAIVSGEVTELDWR